MQPPPATSKAMAVNTSQRFRKNCFCGAFIGGDFPFAGVDVKTGFRHFLASPAMAHSLKLRACRLPVGFFQRAPRSRPLQRYGSATSFAIKPRVASRTASRLAFCWRRMALAFWAPSGPPFCPPFGANLETATLCRAGCSPACPTVANRRPRQDRPQQALSQHAGA